MLDSVAVDVSTSVVCATCVGVTLWRRNIFPYPLEAVLVFSCMSEVRPQSSVSVYFLPVCCGCSAVKLTSTRLYLLHSSSNLLTVLSLHTHSTQCSLFVLISICLPFCGHLLYCVVPVSHSPCFLSVGAESKNCWFCPPAGYSRGCRRCVICCRVMMLTLVMLACKPTY